VKRICPSWTIHHARVSGWSRRAVFAPGAIAMYSARSVASLTMESLQFGSPLCLASSSESFQCGRFGAIHFEGSVGIGAHARISR
jgi:hypothetical protein